MAGEEGTQRREDPQPSRARNPIRSGDQGAAATLVWEKKKELKTKQNKQKGRVEKEKAFIDLTFYNKQKTEH